MKRLITLITIIFSSALTVLAQQNGSLNGDVVTNDGSPASFVSVGLKGTRYGTATDEKGHFSFKAPAGTYTLTITGMSANAYESEITIQPKVATNLPAITINISASELKQVDINGNANRFSRKNSYDVAKTPLSNLENPQVYTTISSELLKEQQIFTVDQAVRNAPGIQPLWQATNRGGDGGSYYTLRGFVTQSSLRNGVFGNVTSAIDAANLENLEIIKGPSATLYGSAVTSYGGLINRVTKKPQLDNFFGEVNYSAGNYGFNRAAIDINAPLSKDVAFRLNTAGNYKNSLQGIGSSTSLAIAPSLLIKANDRLSFLVEAELFRGKASSDPFFFFFPMTQGAFNGMTPKDLNFDFYTPLAASDIAQKSRSSNYFAQATYKLSDNWTSQTNFTHSRSWSDGYGAYYYVLGNNMISRNDQSTRNSGSWGLQFQQNFNGDVKIAGLRNRILVGLDFYRRNDNQTFLLASADVIDYTQPFSYGSFNKSVLDAKYNGIYGTDYFDYLSIGRRNTYGAYVSDVVNITDQLIASAGIRFEHFDNIGDYSQNAWSPKFGLVYQLLENEISLFANYQNSFRNLGRNPLTNSAYKLEQANQFEGGVKFNTFNGKLSSTISYYDIRVKDVLRTVGPLVNIQDGTQLSKGFELEVVANPVQGMNVVAGFAYNDSKLTDAGDDVNGLRPTTAGSPYNANFYISYRFQEASIKGLGIGFGGNHASANKVVNSHMQGVFSLPAYTLLNANAFYEKGRYRLGVTVNNLTDKEYYIGYTTINPQYKRQCVGTVAYKF